MPAGTAHRLSNAGGADCAFLQIQGFGPRRSFMPEIMRWQTDEAACLDAIDPERRLRAGLGAFWQARSTAAASEGDRQIGEVDGDGRLSDEMSHPSTYLQLRNAPAGTMPPYRFILMRDLFPGDIRAAYGEPERIVPCHLSSIWIYPENGSLTARVWDRARAMVGSRLQYASEARIGSK